MIKHTNFNPTKMWDELSFTKLKLGRVGMGRVLHLGPSWHGPIFMWAELAWAELVLGRVVLHPSEPVRRQVLDPLFDDFDRDQDEAEILEMQLQMKRLNAIEARLDRKKRLEQMKKELDDQKRRVCERKWLEVRIRTPSLGG